MYAATISELGPKPLNTSRRQITNTPLVNMLSQIMPAIAVPTVSNWEIGKIPHCTRVMS